MLYPVIVLLALCQEPRQRIEDIVHGQYKFHPDKQGLIRKFHKLWQDLPSDSSLRQDALDNMDANSRGIIGFVEMPDIYRKRVGKHAVYERLLLPESYYQRAYRLAEDQVTSELTVGATFRGNSPEVQRLLHEQTAVVFDETQRVLKQAITGEGGARLIADRLVETRAILQQSANSRWNPLPRPMTADEWAEVLAGIRVLPERLQPINVPRYPRRREGHRMFESMSHAELAAIEIAKEHVEAGIKAAWRMSTILRPASAARKAAVRALAEDASAYMKEAAARERATLNELLGADLAGERHEFGELVKRNRAEGTRPHSQPTTAGLAPAPCAGSPEVVRKAGPSRALWFGLAGGLTLAALALIGCLHLKRSRSLNSA